MPEQPAASEQPAVPGAAPGQALSAATSTPSVAAAGLRLHVPVPVRWEDLDAYEHVNNVAMLRILEEARISAFWRHPGATPAELVPTAVLDSGPEATSHTVVARQEIEYLRPLTYTRVPVQVQLWLGAIGGASIDVCYEVFDGPSARADDDESAPGPYVRALTTVVVVDAVTGNPKRLAQAERDAWTPYVGPPPAFRRR